jgi:hypothetical protein
MNGRRLRSALCFGSIIIGPFASAQAPAAGDLDPSGRVLAKIMVTIAEPNTYGHQVSGLRFLVAAESGGRMSVWTDDAGTASVWLRPATYRFVTPDPLVWRNNAYTWDVVMPIRAGTGPIRLSQENASKIVALGPATARSATAAAVPATKPGGPGSAPNPSVRAKQIREGVWFNFGFGYGLLGCKDCSGTLNGFTGGLVLGGTLTPRFLLGVGTTGWTKVESGQTLTVGTLDARLRFYPDATGRFFLTGGLGIGTISGDPSGNSRPSGTGLGVVLGLGMDLRIGENLSLTPFFNGFAIQTSHKDANVGQIGLGLTFQ